LEKTTKLYCLYQLFQKSENCKKNFEKNAFRLFLESLRLFLSLDNSSFFPNSSLWWKEEDDTKEDDNSKKQNFGGDNFGKKS
jgi:hypothetical protein